MPHTATNVLSDREFVLTHTFRSPPAKVFAAYTDPKLVPHWWARPGGPFHVESMDVRPGGTFRFVQGLPNGGTQAFSGTYVEVQPVSRLVYTFLTEGQGEPVTATVQLEDADGGTRLTLTTLCATRQVRDTMLQYGAAAGAKGAWDRLDAFLAKPAEPPASPLGRLGYSTLFVADQDRAKAFYTDVLGLQLVGEAPQPEGHRFIALRVPNQDQFLVLWPGAPGKSGVAKGNIPGHLIFVVDDIDKAFAQLKARGATFKEHAPIKAPFASFVTVVDPDGNHLMVQQQAARAPGA